MTKQIYMYFDRLWVILLIRSSEGLTPPPPFWGQLYIDPSFLLFFVCVFTHQIIQSSKKEVTTLRLSEGVRTVHFGIMLGVHSISSTCHACTII